jgi:glycosyltransferase involved in cell wall biosynthesis
LSPLVSILIPCYNAAPWLAQTLESALAQTAPRCEIILVDDGSTDNSLGIARGFESRDVRVVTQPNRGASAARNHGLRLARGDYLQFLDADDLLAPDKIERQLAAARAGDDDVLLSAAWGRFLESPERADFRSNPLCADLTPVDFLVLALETHNMMHPAAWLTPRRLADAAGPWNEQLSLNDDGEYFARVILAARRVQHCATARSFYRSGLRRSLSRSRSERAWTSQLRSTELTVEQLLARENSARTRRAAADALQRDIFDAYPSCQALRERLQARVAALGGSELRYEAGPRFQLLARLLGWRLAKRLRNRFA